MLIYFKISCFYTSIDKVCLLGGHTVKGFELDVKKALSKEEMKEAEYKQEQKQHQREERGRGDDRGRDEPMYKRQRMDQQWNSGSNIFFNGWLLVWR